MSVRNHIQAWCIREKNYEENTAYCWHCIGFALLFLLFPHVEAEDTSIPVLMIEKNTGEITQTSAEINGVWVKSVFDEFAFSYVGEYRIKSVPYTHTEGWNVNAGFSEVSGKNYLQGHFGYKSPDGDLESMVVYTDKDHTVNLLVDGVYVLYAPAETVEDAERITAMLGMELYGNIGG